MTKSRYIPYFVLFKLDYPVLSFRISNFQSAICGGCTGVIGATVFACDRLALFFISTY